MAVGLTFYTSNFRAIFVSSDTIENLGKIGTPTNHYRAYNAMNHNYWSCYTSNRISNSFYPSINYLSNSDVLKPIGCT